METCKYIITNRGIPYLSDELKSYQCDRLALMNWEDEYAYDESCKWVNTVENIPKYSLLQKLLAHTFWNPQEKVTSLWKKVGNYKLSEIIDNVTKGLEDDDDIIQQWFNGDQVIQLLESAKDFNETIQAVRAICGEHETDENVKNYVKKNTNYYS